VFRRLFSKKRAPLAGTPAVRRQKNYSARTGYVYQYFYEGHRPHPGDGIEFVFSISADRKNWTPLAVVVGHAALGAWEQAHGRQLTATERYAVAKMALFQAFDERPVPALMKDPVHVRAADIEAIIDDLGL
jgi:hypothetical protein